MWFFTFFYGDTSRFSFFIQCETNFLWGEIDGSILESFKLVDFEYSGKVDERYPFLGMKNPDIAWPSDFISYAPRKFEHDEYMLKQIVISDWKKNIEEIK